MSLTISKQSSIIAPPAPTINTNETFAGDVSLAVSAAMAAGSAGTLSTRTSAVAGVVTLEAGHGLVTGDVIDISWDAGERLGVTATVSVNDITFSGGSGDDLPAKDYAIVASKPQNVDCRFDGSDVAFIAATATAKATVRWLDASGTAILTATLAANAVYEWNENLAATNPLDGESIARVTVSNHSSSAAAFTQASVASGRYST
jgi:hypothetical protein